MRGIGVTALLEDLPTAVVLLFAVVTQLGDAWFVFTATALLYWRAGERLSAHPRRSGATLIGVGLTALGVTLLLKSLFALPRPPGATTEPMPAWLPALVAPAVENAATGTGFGFPSGHATATTMWYGAAAACYERVLDRRRRIALAGAVVVLVALSRLVLGVHFLVDVVVGAAVGGLALLGVLRVATADDRLLPDRVFLVAAGLSLLALGAAAAGGHAEEVFEAGIGLGSALGGLLAWRRFGPGVRVPDGVIAVALVVTGGTWGGVYALAPPLPVTVVGSALAVGAIVALPGLVELRRGGEPAQNVSR